MIQDFAAPRPRQFCPSLRTIEENQSDEETPSSMMQGMHSDVVMEGQFESEEEEDDLSRLELELEPLSRVVDQEIQSLNPAQASVLTESQEDSEELFFSGNSFLAISRQVSQGKSIFGIAVLLTSANGCPILQLSTLQSYEKEDFRGIEELVSMLLPNKIILPSGSNPQIIRCIRQALMAPLGQDGAGSTRFKKGNSPFYFVKAAEVDVESALKLVTNRVRLLTQTHTSISFSSQLSLLSQYFDCNDYSIVSAIASLILFHSSQFQSDVLMLGGISTIHFQDLLHMERESFSELQIFIQDWHPSMVKGRGRSKEGLSLFACFNRTATKHGYFRLRDIFLSPVNNLEVLRQRHLFAEFCGLQTNLSVDFLEELHSCLRRIIDYKYFLKKVNAYKDGVHDWIIFYESLAPMLYLLKRCLSLEHLVSQVEGEADYGRLLEEMEELDLLEDIGGVDEGQIARIKQILDQIVDFDVSIKEERIGIKEGVYGVLDELKEKERQMDEQLAEATEEVTLMLEEEVLNLLGTF